MVVQGNKTPLSAQVAQVLQQRVRTGLYQTGSPLPPVRLLRKEFNVSQGVVQQAIRKLEEVGVVKAHHGKGVLVQNEDPCERTAILFGFIHPYQRSMGFHVSVLDYVDEAFSERSNFAIVRSSKDNPAFEREIAEHMIANGVQGLILWPTNNDPNGGYFTKLAETIPVVLVDRLLPGADVPAVVLDYHGCGREIGERLLGRLNKKRLLVLVDNLRISSYQRVVLGIEEAARDLKRMNDVTMVQLPISKAIEKANKMDFSGLEEIAIFIERMLIEGEYDALFCTQDEVIQECFAYLGLGDKFPGVQLATVQARRIVPKRHERYAANCLEWVYNTGEMISEAADLVQRWVLSRQTPREGVSVKFRLNA